MKRQMVWSSLACLGLLSWFAGPAFGQNKDEKPAAKPGEAKPAEAKPAAKPAEAKPAAPASTDAKGGAPAKDKAGGMPGKDDMMKAMAKMSEPNEFHGYLKPMVGKWSYVTKFRMSPDQPWEESKGTGDFEMIMGGRYLVQKIKGDPDPKMPMAFEGFGTVGYDKMQKKYFSTWMDNWGTGIMTSTGTADASGKTITYTGEYDDPMGGGKKKSKSVQKMIGPDKMVLEMYDVGPDGKEFMSLEVAYTKK